MYTRNEAIKIARAFGLEEEVTALLQNGYTPNEALAEWDLLS